MYLDIHYILIHSKNNIPRKAKTSYLIILKGEREYHSNCFSLTHGNQLVDLRGNLLPICILAFFSLLSWYIHLLLTPWMIGLVLSQGNDYEPVLGNVSRNPHLHNGICWTHGNFVARKKGSGVFSFLTAPRSVFFYELAYMNGFRGVVTCTPVGMVYFSIARCIFSSSFSYVFAGRSCISFASAKCR